MTDLFNNFLAWLQISMDHKYNDPRVKLELELPDGVSRVVWVHELCECPEKAKFECDFPDLAATVRYKPAVMLGELIHIALEKWGLEYTPQVYHKTLDVDGERVMVAGMPDYVSKSLDTVVDFKYSAHIGQEPLQHHVLQVQLYMWLCDVKNGELWYFTHDSFKPFSIDIPASDENVMQEIRHRSTPRWPEWECKYCEFRQICRYG